MFCYKEGGIVDSHRTVHRSESMKHTAAEKEARHELSRDNGSEIGGEAIEI